MIKKLKYAWYRYKFKRDGYVKIPKVLSKEIIELYKGFIDLTYTRGLRERESGTYLNGDIDRIEHNPVDDSILLYCKHIAEKIFDHKELAPAYSFAREYFKGSELLIHKDREACQFTLTLTICRRGQGHAKICFSDDTNKTNPIEIDLDEGDVLVFNGAEAYEGSRWHWRDPLTLDSLYQLFLHYVALDNLENADFPYPKPNYRSK